MCVWGHASATASLVQLPAPLESSSSHTVTRASLRLLPGSMSVEKWGFPHLSFSLFTDTANRLLQQLNAAHHLLVLHWQVITTTHDLVILHVQIVTTDHYSTKFTDTAYAGCYNSIQHTVY